MQAMPQAQGSSAPSSYSACSTFSSLLIVLTHKKKQKKKQEKKRLHYTLKTLHRTLHNTLTIHSKHTNYTLQTCCMSQISQLLKLAVIVTAAVTLPPRHSHNFPCS